MFPRLLALLTAFCAACICAQAQIDVGASRDEVLRLFGKPTSIAQRGERELFLYPKGSRIELIGGKVADIRGPLPPVVAPASAPATTVEAPAQTAPATEPAPPPAAAPAPATVAPKESTPAPKSDAPLERLSREIEKMEKAGEHEDEDRADHGFNILELLISVVLHFGITVFALRVAFKYWEMDAFWRGTLAIAGIDLAVYAVLELLGPVTSGISTSGAVQGGIGTLVMVPTVQHFCFNKRLQNAVVTALAVKVIVQLCHMFVFVILLNALFG